MARTVEIERDKIVDAAVELIDERGGAALSARAVADRLGVSTQPIYREFGDMESLRSAAVARALDVFAAYLDGEALDQATRYVLFASERPRLFDFLFRGKNIEYSDLDELSHRLMRGTDIIDRLTEMTGLSREKTYRVHLFLWMALHGLATMTADNRATLGESEIRAFTVDLNRALCAYYKDVE